MVANELNRVLDILARLVTAAGVCGPLIVGSADGRLAAVRGGDKRLSRFAMVMGACVSRATAEPIAGFVL